MPDYFVPLDTTRFTKCYREISAKGIIISSNLKYIDKNRSKLNKSYSSFQKFRNKFQVPKELIEEIYAEADKQNIRPADDEEKAKTTEKMELMLKALIARDLWDMSEYFSIVYEEDDVVMKAVELLQQ